MARIARAHKRPDELDTCDAIRYMIIDKLLILRSACGALPDALAERCPMAYVHLVTVLVESLLILPPLAMYPKVGVFTIPLVGTLTLFYKGA